MANVWTTSTTSAGISSVVKVQITLDLTDEQYVEQAKLELARKMQARARKLTESQVRDINANGKWDLTASGLCDKSRVVSPEKAMDTVLDGAKNGTVDVDALTKMMARLQETVNALKKPADPS